MRWVFVTFVVCVAVASANLLDVNSFDKEQNNIDVFLPRSSLNHGQGLDRPVRAFYYNYWLYPGMSFKPRVPYMEMSPYMDYNYMEPLTFQDVFEKPVFVVTPSPNAQNAFSMFYLHNGLRTLHIHHAFSWLQEFFKHPGLKGLIFYPHLIYNVRFSNTPISSVTLPDDLRMIDFVSIQECNNGKIPYMFVAPEDLFDRMHFENLAKVSDFKVYNDAIEVHPVVAQPRPVYEPFYGIQSQQGSQGHHAAPPQPSNHPAPPQPSGEISESGSSVNTVDYRSDANQIIEQPQVLVQSERLVASQAGRGAYGEVGYASEYGYGQNLGNSGQYNVDYGQGQSRFNQLEASRMVNAAQPSSNSHNQGAVVGTQVGTGAQVNAPYGASRNINGAQSGAKVAVQSASMASSGAKLGQSQNAAELRGGQVKYFEASKGSGNINTEEAQVGISRVEGGSIGGQLSGSEGSKLVGSQSLKMSVQNTGKVMRTDSGITQGQRFSASNEGVAPVGVSGQRSVAGTVSSVESGSVAGAGSLSKSNLGSPSSGQSTIFFPKEVEIEGSAGVESQGGIASESVSRTGAQSVEYVTKSHSQVQSSGASVQGGNLVRSESAKFEGQAGVQGGISAGLNAGIISGAKSGGVEHVTESFSFSGSTGQSGLIRSGGNVGGLGGEFGLTGKVGGKSGLSGNIGSGMIKLGSGIVKNIDVTTHGLGVDLLRHHEGVLEQAHQSGSISTSTSVSKSFVSSSNVETSTLNSDPLIVSKPIISSGRSLVSSGRSLNEENTSAGPLPPVMMTEAIAT